MKVVVKKLIKTKWEFVPLQEITGMSIAEYIANSSDVVVAALFDDSDQARVFISNNDKERAKYKDKGFCISPENLLQLVGKWPEQLTMFGKEFPLGTLKEIEIIKE